MPNYFSQTDRVEVISMEVSSTSGQSSQKQDYKFRDQSATIVFDARSGKMPAIDEKITEEEEARFYKKVFKKKK